MNSWSGWARLIAFVLTIFIPTTICRAERPYVHSFTGFEFPQEVAAFKQEKVTPFNKEHSDIEVDYNNSPFTIHLSVYVYPVFDNLKTHYAGCRDAVIRATPDARILEEKPASLKKNGVTYDGYSALLTFKGRFVGNNQQQLLSQVLLFQRGDYYVLFRISYAESDEAAEKHIAEFLDQLAWPADTPTKTQVN